ncbi:AraC family transcriptional regulator [Paenibacillus sp. LHD-117]|uniref:helix-turn-helix transcriptional regulator n=1 Tax=Paenibacillus sp. LHD-117 TaxID=3071412 RepID=UPI0027E1D8BD|nr:AraC family transcriptional regulator [Paenibacillus sp. LHD-117]MDQ6419593.1 AraC family transcriptional regulator [Paenibacillus sp. LHD-117]
MNQHLWLNSISPFVRTGRIMKSYSLTGEWMDHDHVYTYIEQGEAEFILSGVKYEVGEGDVIIMHPLMSHLIRSTSDLPLIQYIFHFDLFYDENRSRLKNTSAVHFRRDDILAKEMSLADIHPVAHLKLADRMECKKRFLQLQQEITIPVQKNILLIKSLCLELLHLFFKNQSEHNQSKGKMTKGWPTIERAIECMNKRYHDPLLKNEDVSNYAGVTPNHLSYLFKNQLGISIYNYLKHVRIEQAKLKILLGNKTITEIAEEVGFSSIHLFSRSFKEHVGITPSKYAATQSTNIQIT